MNDNTDLNHKNAPSHWAQIMGEIVDKLMGTNMSTTISFDNLEIEVPQAKGPNGKDLGSAKWVINGKILWTSIASNKE